MAHFKRKRPRTRSSPRSYDKWKFKRMEARGEYFWWMGNWPAWWDIVFHRRPARRRAARLLSAIYRGADPEAVAWPVNKKPHQYFW